MFTGIVETLGKVVKYDGKKLQVRAPLRAVHPGESISVDGVCLTVAHRRGSLISFDVGPETARVTTLGTLVPGSRVNLERALRKGDRVGGHWVSGHVEQTGRIQRIERAGKNRWFTLSLPNGLQRYVIPKGSLAVDGISLTVVSVKGRQIRLMIIPHTLKRTTLGLKKTGDRVNVETDMLVRMTATL